MNKWEKTSGGVWAGGTKSPSGSWRTFLWSCIWRKHQEEQTSGMFCLPSCDSDPKPANRKTDGWMANKAFGVFSLVPKQSWNNFNLALNDVVDGCISYIIWLGNRCTWKLSDSFINLKFSSPYSHQTPSEHFTINWNHVNLTKQTGWWNRPDQSVIITKLKLRTWWQCETMLKPFVSVCIYEVQCQITYNTPMLPHSVQCVCVLSPILTLILWPPAGVFWIVERLQFIFWSKPSCSTFWLMGPQALIGRILASAVSFSS